MPSLHDGACTSSQLSKYALFTAAAQMPTAPGGRGTPELSVPVRTGEARRPLSHTVMALPDLATCRRVVVRVGSVLFTTAEPGAVVLAMTEGTPPTTLMMDVQPVMGEDTTA